ncbi:unnamed protein product [Camellia sinensis]
MSNHFSPTTFLSILRSHHGFDHPSLSIYICIHFLQGLSTFSIPRASICISAKLVVIFIYPIFLICNTSVSFRWSITGLRTRISWGTAGIEFFFLFGNKLRLSGAKGQCRRSLDSNSVRAVFGIEPPPLSFLLRNLSIPRSSPNRNHGVRTTAEIKKPPSIPGISKLESTVVMMEREREYTREREG